VSVLPSQVRREAWKFLLGLYPAGMAGTQRAAARVQRAMDYRRLLAQWQSISERQAARFAKWREVGAPGHLLCFMPCLHTDASSVASRTTHRPESPAG